MIRRRRNEVKKLIRKLLGRDLIALANIAEGTHGDGNITKKADAAMATRNVLVKIGSDIDHVAVTTACTEIPLGVCNDEAAAAEDNVNIQLLGQKPGTILIVGTATAGDLLEAAANGKAVTLTGGAGAHYIIGRALNTATDDLIEVAHCLPVLRTV
jgi:hypothetical protein